MVAVTPSVCTASRKPSGVKPGTQTCVAPAIVTT